MSNEINAVKDYLQDMLGFSAALRPWPEAAFLPRYLSAGREFFLLDIAGEECLLIKTKAASFRLSAFRKQLSKLPDGAPENIVLCFDALSAHQRKALIGCGLSFLVPGSQLYLPFLGAMLQERAKPLRTAPERLSPTGQFLLLHYIYNMCSKSATKAQIAKVTKLSPMNVTRAVQELSLLGLLTVERAGRCDRVTPAAVGYLLYQRAKPFLIDPVQKRMSIKWTSALTNFPFAGESALAQRSMLNDPEVECRAIGRKELKTLSDIELVDPAWSVETTYLQVEVWRYDPRPLANQGCVDLISLSLTFQDQKDERIAQAVDDMMEGYR